ncbi:MAG: linear amide C-N hydrolase [Rhizobacter sp.]|nr:linear amide C-N hydrolase [Bacteriovorax sp.]
MKKIISFVVLIAFAVQPAFPCTIFSLYPDGQHWVGRTFDWAYGHGYVYTNKRNVTKISVRLLPTDVLSTWTSKYGSVTFNQFGREFPTGGMNEAGLMIDALELLSSVYIPADTRPSFNELQFIQYVLDNFSSVEEMNENLQGVRLAPVGSRLHYFTCDAKKCLTIEWIGGVMVTHLSENLPISSLANNTYDQHLAYAKDFVTFGGNKPVVQDSRESLDRFVRATYNGKFINEYDDKIQRLFAILDDVGSVNNRWQLIYNQDERTITFRTKSQFDKQRKIELNAFDFDCHSTVKYFDIDSEIQGSINDDFMDFDPAANYALIKKSVDMQKLPAQLADRLAVYPNETKCN